MRSYWAQFARTGSPGRGLNGDLPEWVRWNTLGPNLMLLDTLEDGGPRMVEEPMTVAMLKKRIAEDQDFPDLRARCALYVRLFLVTNSGDDMWNKSDYEALGCAEFEPWSLEADS